MNKMDFFAVMIVFIALISVSAMALVGRHGSAAQQSFLSAPCPERSGYIACTIDGYSICAENTPRYVCRDGHWQVSKPTMIPGY